MSSTEEQAADVCASCGVKEDVDNVKLKKCTGCDGLVKYCSVECQKNHRPQHKKACKKRAAEIRDNRLFRQTDTSHRECPICFLPLPLDAMKYTMKACCSKYICLGCFYANTVRQEEESLEPSCPFCREPNTLSQEEAEQTNMQRVEANDTSAINYEAFRCYDNGNYEGAFQYWKKAAGLGSNEAHHQLSCLYHDGMGVERDTKKEMHHMEEAAIGGHANARYNLGNYEATNGNFQRAIKHLIIATNIGHDVSLEKLKELYAWNCPYLSKEEYETAIQGHQAAVDATKSEKREEAYAFYEV